MRQKKFCLFNLKFKAKDSYRCKSTRKWEGKNIIPMYSYNPPHNYTIAITPWDEKLLQKSKWQRVWQCQCWSDLSLLPFLHSGFGCCPLISTHKPTRHLPLRSCSAEVPRDLGWQQTASPARGNNNHSNCKINLKISICKKSDAVVRRGVYPSTSPFTCL